MYKLKDQSGFAIGAILLAVVLIAAVVGAISAGSSGSSTVSNREKDRLLASALVAQSVDIGNTIALVTSQTALPIEAIDNTADCSGGADTCYALFSPVDGMNEPRVPDQLIVANTGGVYNNKGEWIYRDDVRFQTNGGTDVGTASDDVVIFVKGLSDNVCSQLNNIVNNISPSNGLTEITSGSFDPSSTAVYSGEHSSIDFRPMGCNRDTTNSYNFFYSVLQVQ